MPDLITTKKTKQNLPFRTTRDAIQAIQNTTLTDCTLALVTTSTEWQTLVRKLSTMPRPFGVVVVRPKD